MAGARDDRGSPARASLGAGANELSTRVGEKGVHERVNCWGAGGFGSLPAGGAGGGAERGNTVRVSVIPLPHGAFSLYKTRSSC